MKLSTFGEVKLDTFGKRLKFARLARGMNQVELRDEMKKFGVEIGETYISELERTSKMPMLDVAAGMAQALKVSVDFLALIIEEPLPYVRNAPAEPHYMSPEADEVAKLVDDMSAEQRDLVALLARGLSSLPRTRQQRREDLANLLDSVEVEFGVEMRKKVEQFLLGGSNGSAAK